MTARVRYPEFTELASRIGAFEKWLRGAIATANVTIRTTGSG